jgi:hypothetical protein
MRTVLWTGLLLVAVTGSALADNAYNRFNDDFGGGSPPASAGGPAASAPPPAAVAPRAAPATPSATAAPAETDSGLIVPKPKRRPVREGTRNTPDADVSAFAQEPVAHPATPPAPAVKAIKAAAPVAGGEYQVGISWNAVDPSWDGMFVTNTSGGSLSLLGLELNDRPQCRLKAYSLDKIKQVLSLQQAMKAWGSAAINLIGLPKMATDSVLAPELPRNMQDLGIAPVEATLKSGDRVPIVNGTKCNPVVAAKVDTDGGAVSIKFKRPYSGH